MVQAVSVPIQEYIIVTTGRNFPPKIHMLFTCSLLQCLLVVPMLLLHGLLVVPMLLLQCLFVVPMLLLHGLLVVYILFTALFTCLFTLLHCREC